LDKITTMVKVERLLQRVEYRSPRFQLPRAYAVA
jgi:hypothetical protein